MDQGSEKKKPMGVDVAGYDWLTEAIRALVNQFPGVENWEQVAFASLADDGGTAFYPAAGAVIEEEKVSVTGKVRQVCRYGFMMAARLTAPMEAQRLYIKEWLDSLGRWLEGQTVTVDGQQYELAAYPPMKDGRRFLSFERMSAGYMDGVSDDHVETWAIALAARYENIFMKKH